MPRDKSGMGSKDSVEDRLSLRCRPDKLRDISQEEGTGCMNVDLGGKSELMI